MLVTYLFAQLITCLSERHWKWMVGTQRSGWIPAEWQCPQWTVAWRRWASWSGSRQWCATSSTFDNDLTLAVQGSVEKTMPGSSVAWSAIASVAKRVKSTLLRVVEHGARCMPSFFIYILLST